MSGLSEAVACYLATRRALGFRLEGTGQLLEQFAAFAEAAGQDTVTTELALRWATLPASRSRAWHAERLSAVRGFARWLRTLDSQAQVPPAGLLPGSTRRAVPYLYSEADITALMAAAGRLNPPWKAITMQTLTGLLFATGVRLGEALSLDRGDLDPAAGLLTVRETKFRKPRQLPLHRSAVTALAGYAARRDELRPRPATTAFFVSTTGARLARTTVQETFRRLLRPGRHLISGLAACGRASTTPGTRSRSPPCSAGTATAATCRPGCRCCPPGSGMPTRGTPTGTCRLLPSCSRWPPSGSSPARQGPS